MHAIGYRDLCGESTGDIMLAMRDIFWQAFHRRRLSRLDGLVQVVRRRKSPRYILRKRNLNSALFCYKEPFMCFAMRQLAEQFPQSKIIHIIRDGRDNADSLERTYPHALSDEVLSDEFLATNKNSEIGIFRRHERYCIPWWVTPGEESRFIKVSRYARCVWMWKEMVDRVRECGTELGESRYLEVRYESLANDPLVHASRIARFLNVTPEPYFLRAIRGVRTVSVGISKKRQDKATIEEANFIAGDLMQRLGYSID